MADSNPSSGAPPGVRWLQIADISLARLEESVLGAALVTLLLVACYEAVKLHFIGHCPAWPNEIIRYLVFTIGVVGAAAAAQSDRLFNIDMLTRLVGPRGRLLTRITTSLFTVFACMLVFRGSQELYKVVVGESGEGTTLSPTVAVRVLEGAVIAIGVHMGIHALVDIAYLMTGRLPPEHHIVHGTSIDEAMAHDDESPRMFACNVCGWEGPEPAAVKGSTDPVTYLILLVAIIVKIMFAGWVGLAVVGALLVTRLVMVAAAASPICPQCTCEVGHKHTGKAAGGQS